MARGDNEGEVGVVPISRWFITAADHSTAQRHSVAELEVAVCRSSMVCTQCAKMSTSMFFSIIYESGF